MPSEEQRRDPAGWVRLIAEHGVTIVNCVPALLDMLLEANAGRPLPSSLRLALASGDWVGPDLPGRLAAVAPGCRLVALGGATEAGIWSTATDVGDGVPEGWVSVPYGAPLRGQRCRVVDWRGRDRPDWVPGELWIGGDSLAEGYWGERELTAERFVEREGRRWYRTGDRARYWPDGKLEFLGRADHQVKVRGHRIELGEIEAVLGAHAAVARAVAVVLEDPRRLAAAYTTTMPVAGEQLRHHLEDRLPAYMVPGVLAELERLPLSPNGKVDRGAIASELAGRAAHVDEDDPLDGPLEREIGELCMRLLDVSRLGRRTSLFALGADSLLATRLVEELRGRFGVDLRLRDVFAHDSAAGLAMAVARELGDGGEEGSV